MQYYLWNGIGAIEELDCSLDGAIAALNAKTSGDWTLWQRDAYNARLVAIHLPQQREIRTGRFGGNGVFEEFVFD